MALTGITFTLMICWGWLVDVEGFAAGSTTNACADMRPQHNLPAKVTPPPYTIKTSKTTYKSHELISVTISGTEPIAGVLIEAVSTDKNKHVGYFQTQDSNDLRTVSCGEGDAATNKRKLHLNTLTVIWRAPTQTVGDVVMTATVVKDYSTFWLKIKSSVMREILPTLPPQHQITPPPLGAGGQGNWYGNCKTVDEGYGLASLSSESYRIKWTYIPCTTPPEVEFDITADVSDMAFGNSWVAIAFSKDKYMGDDSVVECVQTQTSQVSFRVSYNQPNTKNNVVIPGVSAGLTPLAASVSNGQFNCKFRRAVSVLGGDYRIFDLSAQSYHLLVARGRVLANGVKLAHSLLYKKTPVISMKFINFLESGDLKTMK